MTSRHLRLLLPRTRRLRRAACVALCMLVLMGLPGTGTAAGGQRERSHAAVTEIWMSGEDLAVTRRIPQDRRSAQRSYDEVAQAMVKMAESRYRDRDEKSAEWLHQWARELTDGRIGNSPRTPRRQWRSVELVVPAATQPDSLEREDFAPSIQPEFDPAGLAIEWPIAAFSDTTSLDEAQPLAQGRELPRSSERRDDGLKLVSQRETEREHPTDGETRPQAYTATVAAAHAGSAPQIERRSEFVVDPQAGPLQDAGRQIALAPTSLQREIADRPDHAAPTLPAEAPTMLALSCFAAGVVCCFVLHTLLLLTPVRLTVCRAEASPQRTPHGLSAEVTQTDAAIEPARQASLPGRPHVAARGIVAAQDKASAMVEEFYNSNIELFEKFAKSVV